MVGQRIDYIDYLKGLSIVWVVWYHTCHPWFVDFSFRIPLFFLASGIFFRIVDFKTYVRKKTNQLLVPLVFFSLIYYVYLILLNMLSSGGLSDFDFGCIFGIFRPHSGNESFVVNPPLWFICALICHQITTWLLVKALKKDWLISVAAIVLTIVGVIYVWHKPTYFMLGRSMPYLVYYVFGHLYGKRLLGIVESKSSISYLPFITASLVYFLSIALKYAMREDYMVLTYFETFGLIVILVYVFKWIYRFRIAYPFWFYGRNSYIVLGLHEIYLTVLWITLKHMNVQLNIWTGMLLTLFTLLLLWPSIVLLNRYVPMLVGKADLIMFKHSK